MRNDLGRATGITGIALAAFGTAIILTSGCGDTTDPLAAGAGLSDADAVLAAPGFVEADPGHEGHAEANVTREVTLTEDGVVITIDSDDPDCIASIQERAAEHADRPRPDDAPPVESTVENTATGVVITISGATEEAIALIQEHATRERGEGGQDGRRGPRPDGDGERLEGVERTVTQTDRGFEIRLESDDQATVEAIQSRNDGEERPRPEGAPEDVTVTVTDIDTGVLITVTGETAAAIELLHSRDPEARPDGGRGGRRAQQG